MIIPNKNLFDKIYRYGVKPTSILFFLFESYYFNSNETSAFFKKCLVEAGFDSYLFSGIHGSILNSFKDLLSVDRSGFNKLVVKTIICVGSKAEEILLGINELHVFSKNISFIKHPSFILNYYPSETNSYIESLKILKNNSVF
jgi:hypothetical protein